MPCPSPRIADDPAAQLVARCGPLVERARRVDERHRLVKLEAVLLLAAHLEAKVLSFGGIACEQSLAHGAREDLREQVQVRVDRLRAQRLHRAPATVDERLADRQGCLDAAVLGELSVEVGLDVAARQFAHGDVAEVRQQVDLELALHVGQAVRAQPLADLALVVLVGELRDRRDFALDVVGLQRRAPGSGENLAGDQPCLVFGTCTIHALVAAPEADHLGRGSRGRGTARCSSRRRCERCARGSARSACEACVETPTGEGGRATRPSRSRRSRARRAGTDRRSRRGEGTPTIRCTPSRGMRSGAVCPVPSLTAPSSAACS